MPTPQQLARHRFILSYEFGGIRWNIIVHAFSHEGARMQAPKGAAKINAEWIP